MFLKDREYLLFMGNLLAVDDPALDLRDLAIGMGHKALYFFE